MDTRTFDDLTRALGGGSSRRTLVQALGGLLTGGLLTLGPGISDAKKNKKKK